MINTVQLTTLPSCVIYYRAIHYSSHFAPFLWLDRGPSHDCGLQMVLVAYCAKMNLEGDWAETCCRTAMACARRYSLHVTLEAR